MIDITFSLNPLFTYISHTTQEKHDTRYAPFISLYRKLCKYKKKKWITFVQSQSASRTCLSFSHLLQPIPQYFCNICDCQNSFEFCWRRYTIYIRVKYFSLRFSTQSNRCYDKWVWNYVWIYLKSRWICVSFQRYFSRGFKALIC